MSYGQDAKVGISFQTSYGTPNVASMHWLEPLSESVTLKKAMIQGKGLRGVYDRGVVQEGANSVDGDITIEAKANALGVFLTAVNDTPTVVNSAALYKYTFKPRQADHSITSAERPFTYLKHMGDTGSAQQYSDLNGNNLTLAVNNGELLTAKLGIVGGTHARIASIAATYSGSNPLDWSVSSASMGGAAVSNIKSLTITQENGIQAQWMLNTSKFPSRNKRTAARMISIAGTLVFDDQTEYNTFLSQSDRAVIVNMVGTAMVQSGYPETLMIEIPAMRYSEFPTVVNGPGQIEVSFKGVAQYHAGSGTAIAYTLYCGKAGY